MKLLLFYASYLHQGLSGSVVDPYKLADILW